MPGIDGMPPMGDVEGYSRRNFLKGAGFVGLSGFLAACQKETDEGSDGVLPRANYDRREQPSPLPIELTNEERGEIDNLARTAAFSILERIRSKPDYLQVFSPEACVMLHMSDDRYEFKVDQNAAFFSQSSTAQPKAV